MNASAILRWNEKYGIVTGYSNTKNQWPQNSISKTMATHRKRFRSFPRKTRGSANSSKTENSEKYSRIRPPETLP